MTKIDHDRPFLKLIDNLRRELLDRSKGPQADGNEQIAFPAIQIKRINWAPSSFQTRADAHRLACSVLAHVAKHRDVRIVTRLIEAVPLRDKSALKAWFEAFGPISFAGDKAHHKPNRILLGDAIETPFWLAERKFHKKTFSR